jgi:hypothetical protein
MRKVIIYSKRKLAIPKKIKNNLDTRHTNIQQESVKRKQQERIELYGYDKTLKYKSRKVTNKTLKNIITKIDKMPMGAIEMQIRKNII